LHFEDSEDIFLDRELAKDGWLLRQIADAVFAGPEVHGDPGDIDIIGKYLSGIGSDEADNDVKASSLAGAIGSEQPDDLPLGDFKVDPANYLPAFIGLTDFVCTKLLHSFCDPGLGHSLASAATHHDAIIAIIEKQRVTGNRSAYLIGETRRG
jgi:hypothetical protein